MSARQSWNGYSPKKRRLAGLWVFVVLCLLGALGFAWLRFTPLNRFSAASLRALRSDPEAVFYSIEPWSEANGQQGFRGHHIVGQHRLAVQGEREAIAGWIAAAARGAWDRAACFNPRHGFRARGPEGTYDFLLCFECGQAVVHGPEGRSELVLITGRPDFLDGYLRAHSVALPDH